MIFKSLKNLSLNGIVIQGGNFAGKVVYVKNIEDLQKVEKSTIAILLPDCPRQIAISVFYRATAVVTTINSMTSHIIISSPINTPFAVCPKWPTNEIKENEKVNVKFKEEKNLKSGELPSVKTIFVDNIYTGQKAARLWKLTDLGYDVPRFMIIDFAKVESWLSSTNVNKLIEEYLSKNFSNNEMSKVYESKLKEEITNKLPYLIEKWIAAMNINLEYPLAIRSSANLEDGQENIMAGAFKSILNVNENQLQGSILNVILSTYSSEIFANYKKCILNLKQSILIQEMVKKPKLSGTIFLRSPDNPGSLIIESKFKAYGEDLMNSKVGADVRIRMTHDLSHANIEINKTNLDEKFLLDLFYRLADEAKEIYWLMGCDDSEFCIDDKNKIWWIQSRLLPTNKNDISREPMHYFNLHDHFNKVLHYRTWESNLMSSYNIKIMKEKEFSYNLKENILWGSKGEIYKDTSERDLQFHIKASEDLDFLKKIVKYGLKVEKELKKSIHDEEPLGKQYLLLTLHQGARAGSYGYRHRFKEMYNTKNWKEIREKWIENLINKVANKIKITTEEAINLLYTPKKTISAIYQQEKRVELYKKNNLLDEDFENIILPEIHDPAQLSIEKEEEFKKILEREKEIFKINSESQSKLILNQLKKSFNEKKIKKENLIIAANKYLLKDEKNKFMVVALFLEMKGEMNETHPIYRGIIFLKIGKLFKELRISHGNTTIDKVAKILKINKLQLNIKNMKKIFN